MAHIPSPSRVHWTDAKDVITRSRDEARDIIRQHIDTLSKLSGEERNQKFAAIATEESDCSSARKGGDLGFFGKNMMQAAFEVSLVWSLLGDSSDAGVNSQRGAEMWGVRGIVRRGWRPLRDV